jgi:hypothetical protein
MRLRFSDSLASSSLRRPACTRADLTAASSATRRWAARIARRSSRAYTARSSVGRELSISCQMVSAASLLATSPPATPPIPSHTRNKGPRGPAHSITLPEAASSFLSRSPIESQSSLASRTRP